MYMFLVAENMDYRLLFKESNEEVRERYELAIARIRQMKDEHVKD